MGYLPRTPEPRKSRKGAGVIFSVLALICAVIAGARWEAIQNAKNPQPSDGMGIFGAFNDRWNKLVEDMGDVSPVDKKRSTGHYQMAPAKSPPVVQKPKPHEPAKPHKTPKQSEDQ